MGIWEAGTGIWEEQCGPSDPREFLSTGKGESRESGPEVGLIPILILHVHWGEVLIPSGKGKQRGFGKLGWKFGKKGMILVIPGNS